ncbi:nuclear transport factor 2 family protein [Bradyrhizobium sp. RDT10]
MTSSQGGFDPIGIIVDWLDACREGRLAALIDLYDDGAILDCCQGGTFRGRLGVERYWRSKLAHPAAGAFEVDALCPETGGVCLDYRAYDGTPVRTHFTFTKAGKIRHTACAPIRQAA